MLSASPLFLTVPWHPHHSEIKKKLSLNSSQNRSIIPLQQLDIDKIDVKMKSDNFRSDLSSRWGKHWRKIIICFYCLNDRSVLLQSIQIYHEEALYHCSQERRFSVISLTRLLLVNGSTHYLSAESRQNPFQAPSTLFPLLSPTSEKSLSFARF